MQSEKMFETKCKFYEKPSEIHCQSSDTHPSTILSTFQTSSCNENEVVRYDDSDFSCVPQNFYWNK